MAHIFAPLAYDRMPYGQPRQNVPINRLGSKARIDVLLKKMFVVLDTQEDHLFVFVAGFSKNSPDTPTTDTPVSLAEEMDRYANYQTPALESFWGAQSWGTHDEIYSVIATGKLVDTGEDHDVYIATNLGHMPRVMLTWFFLEKPESWRIHFVPAKHSFSPKEWVQETVKFFTYLYRFVFKKW